LLQSIALICKKYFRFKVKSVVLDLRRDVGERIKETPAVWRRACNFRGGEPEVRRAVIAGISLKHINPTMRLPAS